MMNVRSCLSYWWAVDSSYVLAIRPGGCLPKLSAIWLLRVRKSTGGKPEFVDKAPVLTSVMHRKKQVVYTTRAYCSD